MMDISSLRRNIGKIVFEFELFILLDLLLPRHDK